MVPAPDEEKVRLGTPYGLLLNECARAPQLVPKHTLSLLEQVLSLRTHTYHCKTTEIIEFVVRLVVHVESAIWFCLQLATGQHPALRLEQLPGLELSERTRHMLQATFEATQRMLRIHIRPMLLGWLEELKVEEQHARTYAPHKVDEYCLQMASVHAHLVLCMRNVPTAELQLSDVSQLLLSFMFLQRRHKWNRPPPKPPLFALPISEPELFDVFDALRKPVVDWLSTREEGPEARAVQSLLHSVFETGTGDLHRVTAWARFDGQANAGRYASVVFRTLADGEERPAMPPFLQRVSERDPDVEVNVQLMQVMMKGRFLLALESRFADHPDMQTLFGENQSTMQCVKIGDYTHMEERRLVSHPFSLQLWDEDPRPIETPPSFKKVAFSGHRPNRLPVHCSWLVEVFQPLLTANEQYREVQHEQQKVPIPWYFTESTSPSPSVGVVVLLARHPIQKTPMREAVVYRHHQMVHIFEVHSHGRRFYRQLAHSTNANLTPHTMQPSCDDRSSTWPLWARHEAAEKTRPMVPSLVLLRLKADEAMAEEIDDPAARSRTAARAARERERAAMASVKQEQDEAAAREAQLAELAAQASKLQLVEVIDDWREEAGEAGDERRREEAGGSSGGATGGESSSSSSDAPTTEGAAKGNLAGGVDGAPSGSASADADSDEEFQDYERTAVGAEEDAEGDVLQPPSAQQFEAAQTMLDRRRLQKQLARGWTAAAVAEAEGRRLRQCGSSERTDATTEAEDLQAKRGPVFLIESAAVSRSLADEDGELLSPGQRFDAEHLSGLWVEDAGVTLANGLYSRSGKKNGLPTFKLQGPSGIKYLIYMQPSEQRWVLEGPISANEFAIHTLYVTRPGAGLCSMAAACSEDAWSADGTFVRVEARPQSPSSAPKPFVEASLGSAPSVRALLACANEREVSAEALASHDIELKENCVRAIPPARPPS